MDVMAWNIDADLSLVWKNRLVLMHLLVSWFMYSKVNSFQAVRKIRLCFTQHFLLSAAFITQIWVSFFFFSKNTYPPHQDRSTEYLMPAERHLPTTSLTESLFKSYIHTAGPL